ncbi:hypothetical protein BV20DRAFT_200887 [Pilatotrama ljubarskyi]|nr:hypothetical protein BV20DRAFT_200887 [Pilatotrama ljubarskyi]
MHEVIRCGDLPSPAAARLPTQAPSEASGLMGTVRDCVSRDVCARTNSFVLRPPNLLELHRRGSKLAADRAFPRSLRFWRVSCRVVYTPFHLTANSQEPHDDVESKCRQSDGRTSGRGFSFGLMLKLKLYGISSVRTTYESRSPQDVHRHRYALMR